MDFKAMRRVRIKAEPRDGDGDGFVLDGRAGMRPASRRARMRPAPHGHFDQVLKDHFMDNVRDAVREFSKPDDPPKMLDADGELNQVFDMDYFAKPVKRSNNARLQAAIEETPELGVWAYDALQTDVVKKFLDMREANLILGKKRMIEAERGVKDTKARLAFYQKQLAEQDEMVNSLSKQLEREKTRDNANRLGEAVALRAETLNDISWVQEHLDSLAAVIAGIEARRDQYAPDLDTDDSQATLEAAIRTLPPEIVHRDESGRLDVFKTARAYFVRKAVDEWASSSMDHNSWSIAMQKAAQAKFGVGEVWVNDKYDMLDVSESADRTLARHRPFMDAFLDAAYSVSQRDLADAGIDEVVVYRGMRGDAIEDLPWFRREGQYIAPLTLAPMASWSIDRATALQFSSSMNGVILSATVPRELILSLAVNGLGCLSEMEIVVLGHEGDVNVDNLSMRFGDE